MYQQQHQHACCFPRKAGGANCTIATQSVPALHSAASPFDPDEAAKKPTITRNQQQPVSKATLKKRAFVPRKAAVQLTEKARKFFKLLLKNPPRPDIIGIMLNYGQPRSGEPRMVFSFDFVTAKDVDFDQDEGVSLELVEEPDRTAAAGNDNNTPPPMIKVPKPPRDSQNDGLPKLYVHHHAFLKVLGATVDVDTETVTPILYDRQGNRMDPNV